jgi:hypothetical protein
VADATIERLTARRDQLAQQDDRYFVLHLDAYLNVIDTDRRARRIVKKLRKESDEALKEFKDGDRKRVAELVRIRDRLVSEVPDVRTDRDPPRPEGLDRRGWMLETISGFDLVSGHEQEFGFAPLPYYATGNPGRTQQLVQILRGRIYFAENGVQYGRGPAPAQPARDLGTLSRDVENLQARYTASRRQFDQQQLTLPGLAEERLRTFVAGLNPEPFLLREGEGDDDFMERSFEHVLENMGARGILRKAADGDRLTAAEQDTYDRLVRFLRTELDRLHVELVERLGLEQRSLRGWIRTNTVEAPKKVVAMYVSALALLVVGGSITYARNWIWHHAHHPKPPAAGTHKK